MTKSTITREQLLEIIETDHVQCGEASYLARMALAAMDSEPVAEVYQTPNVGICAALGPSIRMLCALEPGTKLYRHAQPAPVVPENCVTAEHRRVIEMLLNVCGAAFELADDSCQQDVDGEDCHVVPDDAFQKLSDALDEIENTLPTEDIDSPDVFLTWSAMPRAALKSLLQAGNSQVIPDGWTCNDKANAALMMLDRIETVDPVDDDRIDGIKRIVRELAAAPHDTPALNSIQSVDTVADRWIPVSERMPESNGVYFGWDGKRVLEVNCFFGGFSANQFIHGEITHWMPLPAAPQEVNHG
ncbi:DUF551 domain-containing protein [Klebsiella pneumoniae]|uniref:DUF551 domain-containing protein n=1 Tax=Klebsiella pneumoniae TaxID=573 RepID=UPI00349FC971